MQRLILAGGGHAHLHILKQLATRPRADIEVILIAPYARQVYSGMVPGWMAGHYTLDQCAAELGPLAMAAGVKLLRDSVTGVGAAQQTVSTARHGSLSYDVLSLDVGALVDTSCLADTGARLLAIRPLEAFIVGWLAYVEACTEAGKSQLVVVGGGAAGVELALAARHRLRGLMPDVAASVTLVAGRQLLAGHGTAIVHRVTDTLARQGVTVLSGHAAGCPAGVMLDDGREVAADAVIAATGVRPAPWLTASGLALADDGFVAVGDGQRSVSHPSVFGAGDVASRVDAPHAKSGVYAVRAGPVLAENLSRALARQPVQSYRPQRRSLYLLATGPKSAIVSWGGFSADGGWAWHWKDWIDRRFMRQYHLGEQA
ncbi:FAD-dependent oxidoreductase [Dechloromonas sp.]|uniref:FAD-dependent oxidoreductase n=1 Tax=Dechloromonas sp. TaxID=1917218 RepID=UPI00216EBA3D|nr:FAD-dependent oxidoreductase [Dechloromonas sp.]MBU3696373.1 pyridine nucleotide-disulfide oxidoreductase [Dechloromonas sp.]